MIGAGAIEAGAEASRERSFHPGRDGLAGRLDDEAVQTGGGKLVGFRLGVDAGLDDNVGGTPVAGKEHGQPPGASFIGFEPVHG